MVGEVGLEPTNSVRKGDLQSPVIATTRFARYKQGAMLPTNSQ